jgi:hypothetical protein
LICCPLIAQPGEVTLRGTASYGWFLDIAADIAAVNSAIVPELPSEDRCTLINLVALPQHEAHMSLSCSVQYSKLVANKWH